MTPSNRFIRRHLQVSLLYLAAVGLAVGVAVPAQAKEAGAGEALVLKRVMLSTGGVGYFELEAVVDGAGELALTVPLDQVDDVLKSVVVYDDAGGVGAISLPGRQPLGQAFRNLPFGQNDLNSPAALLNALQGAEVNAVGQRKLTGRIIRVVPESSLVDGGRQTVTRHRVSLLTAEGVQQFILEDAESVSFVDKELQRQVADALAAIARHRVRDKRTLRITMTGDTRRKVRVAYVAGAPLWKGTYRLTLPGRKGETGTGHLQGWAVLENASGRDWNNVELTVVSGNPVTFRQAIYASYYVNRPQVPVEVLGRILPRPDTGAVGGRLEEDESEGFLREPRKRAKKAEESALSALVMADKAVQAPPSAPLAGFSPALGKPLAMAAAMAAASSEAAAQVLFRLPMPISVKSGHSLVVPIIDRDVPATRLSVYQPAAHASRPLASVRLVNDASTGLPPGVLTIYDRGASAGAAYVGDARLTTLPAGDRRLVSFALDQKTRIDRTVENRRSLTKGAISRGVFRRTITDRQTTTYRLEAPKHEARTVIVEHPRRAGWTLADPAEKDVELAEGAYRIRIELKAGGDGVVKVVMERPRLETVRVSSLTLDNITAYARAASLSKKVRDAFALLARLRTEVEKHRGKAKALETERKAIFEDQRRVRDNLNRIPRGSDLFNRYVAKLDKQETRLEGLMERLDEILNLQRKAEGALAQYVAGLDI